MGYTATRWQRVPFAWKLTAAVAVTLMFVGTVQYAFGARQLNERVLGQALEGFAGDAKVLTEIHPEGGWAAVDELLGHIRHRPATLGAAIVGADEVALHTGDGEVYEGAADAGHVMPEHGSDESVGTDLLPGERVSELHRGLLHETLATQTAQVRLDPESERDIAVYAVPLELDGSAFVLFIDAEMSLVGRQLEALRSTLLVGFLVAGVLGVPLFYVVGGRRLSAVLQEHQRRATRDVLTALHNHRAFHEYGSVEVERSRRTGRPLVMAMLDLDGFKMVNDTMGHRRGDEILAQVGTVLRRGRATDLAFRVGGDEFALLLPDTDLESARLVVERLRQMVAAEVPDVRVSIGLAELQTDDDLDALISYADAAMYRAKRRGKNLVVAYADIASAEEDITLSKGSALRALLDVDQMAVAFQPVVDPDGGATIGFEALARPPEVAGFAGPQAAFETAERLGLVPELDALCRRAVLRRATELPDGAMLFLNISPSALENDLLDWRELGHDVRVAGLTPDRVVIELTERSRVSAAVLAREVALAREVGFLIAVDDVGAGWTGFACLRATEPDIMKIDRSVVANVGFNRRARATLVAILAYGAVIGARIIAEGIEDEHVLAALKERLVDAVEGAALFGVQGYLFGRPAAIPSLGEWAPSHR